MLATPTPLFIIYLFIITEQPVLLMRSGKKNHTCTLLQYLETLTEKESESFKSIRNCGNEFQS